MAGKRKWTWNAGSFFSKLMLALGIGICLAFSQVAGWSVTGTMLADAGARRDVASTQTDVAKTSLADLRKEKAALALPSKSKEALEADLKLERTRTSKTYKDGDGPVATKIKGDIATLNRKDELDRLIADATKALAKTPATAKGEVDVAIPVGMAQRLGWLTDDTDEVKAKAAADAHFWFVVFFVFATGFFATFGFMLVGVKHDEISLDLLFDKPIVWLPLIVLCVEAGMNALFGWRRADGGFFNLAGYFQAAMFAGMAVLGAYLPTRWNGDAHAAVTTRHSDPLIDPFDWGPKQISARAWNDPERAAAADMYTEMVKRFGADMVDRTMPELKRQAALSPDLPVMPPLVERPGPIRAPDPFQHSAPASASSPSSQHVHGAPIAIHNHFAGGAPGAAQPLLPSPTEREHTRQFADGASRVAAGEQFGGASDAHARALPPLQTGSPVDKRGVMERLVDPFMTFKAARLERVPDATLSSDDMYALYADWAGPRRLDRPTFLALFGEIAGVDQVFTGTDIAFANVAVKTTMLKAVS
jgi:hypothetical protein